MREPGFDPVSFALGPCVKTVTSIVRINRLLATVRSDKPRGGRCSAAPRVVKSLIREYRRKEGKFREYR